MTVVFLLVRPSIVRKKPFGADMDILLAGESDDGCSFALPSESHNAFEGFECADESWDGWDLGSCER